MKLVVEPRGTIRCLYAETLPLAAFGKVQITRGSYVEPTADGQWLADLAPVSGPMLGPFELRSSALDAERHWLESHWLPS